MVLKERALLLITLGAPVLNQRLVVSDLVILANILLLRALEHMSLILITTKL